MPNTQINAYAAQEAGARLEPFTYEAGELGADSSIDGIRGLRLCEFEWLAISPVRLELHAVV